MVCDLERRVRLAKCNVESMSSLMSGWCHAPLFKRKEEKKEQSLLNLEVRVCERARERKRGREGGREGERERKRERDRERERERERELERLRENSI